MLKLNDKVAVVACSNPLTSTEKVEKFVDTLQNIGLKPVGSDYIYGGTAYQISSELMEYYKDDDISCIFDISGGDLGNRVLPLLDYETISKNPKPYFGYSDLTTVINAIYTKTGLANYLYSPTNIIKGKEFLDDFKCSIMDEKDSLFNVPWEFLKGDSIKGIVVGGNIRCLLKLAGTEFMPDFTDKILFLEGYSGDENKLETYLNQLEQLGVFNKISGLLFGTFTQLEEEGRGENAAKIILEKLKEKTFSVAKTSMIGHGYNSKCLIVGTMQEFCKK